MAERYQERPFPSDRDRGGDLHGEADPLAELARLIGQTDPLGAGAKAPPPHPLQSRANIRPQQYHPPEEDDHVAPSPPTWMQRARQEAAPPPLPQDYDEPEYDQPAPVHPVHRYGSQQQEASRDYQEHAEDYYDEPQQYADAESQPDPSRYDDALYGRIESGEQGFQRDPAYPDDPYAYQNDYEEEPEPKKRSKGLMTVAAVLALAVVGTGAAFAYRTFVGSPRSGEPPIIRADNSPTKVVPAPSDAGSKTPDRMVSGDGGEKLVSREETPVDVNTRSVGGPPRVAYPPLNPNSNPPPVASVSPGGQPLAGGANGTMSNNEPRRVRTLTVKGDAAENGGIPAGATAPPAKPASRTAAAPATAPGPGPTTPAAPRNANASANAPMAIAPQGGQAADPAPARVASTNPTQPAAPAASGGYLVQVSSQKNEADAQASYRALQTKFPSVLGPHSSLVKRVDLGEKGVYYRAYAGPFGSSEEAVQVCNSLKSAGGQCLIQRN